jgi:hypothetical protein
MADAADAGGQSTTPKPRRWKRKLRGLLITFRAMALLLVGGVGYVLYMNYEGERHLQETLGSLRGRGLPADLSRFKAQDVSDTDTPARYLRHGSTSPSPLVGEGWEGGR